MSKQQKKEKPPKPGEYKYVSAGVKFKHQGGVLIYVKYGTYPNKIEIIYSTPQACLIQCPDRLLYITIELYGDDIGVSDYDECVALSLFDEASAQKLQSEYFMVNYIDFVSTPGNGHDMRRAGRPKDAKTFIISDSGGFQMFKERVSFIDPYSLVDFYNKNVDIGIVLDVPPRVRNQPKLFRKLAELQAKNTEILMKNKADHVELLNVLHGRTIEDQKLYRKICERDDIDRLAISGAYTGSILSSVDKIFDTFCTGKNYKHYHILGVENILQALLLMRMAAKGMAPLITSDSSSVLQRSINRIYTMQSYIHEPVQNIKIGIHNYLSGTKHVLACGCPVCVALKYQDVLSVIESSYRDSLLFYHNLYVMNNYMVAMTDMMREASLGDIKHIVSQQLSTRVGRGASGVVETMKGLDYIEHITNNGIQSARKKYSYYVSQTIVHAEHQNNENSNDPALLKRMRTILDTYDRDLGKVKKTVFNNVEKTKGTKVTSSARARAKPGSNTIKSTFTKTLL